MLQIFSKQKNPLRNQRLSKRSYTLSADYIYVRLLTTTLSTPIEP